jgi:glycosyltransferase involved in cell wall biosynthesis
MADKITKIAHFTAFLPKACGIATYAFALRKVMKEKNPDMDDFIVAVEDNDKGYKYSSSVKFHFNDKDHEGYKKAAEFINKSDAQVVNIQHEFGLYGAKVNPETLGQDDGKNFLIFLRALKKPAVTTLHMVYKKPAPHHLEVVREICERSVRIVVLADIAKKILVKKYNISPDKIIVIPHGAPNVPRYSSGFFKEMMGFSKKDTIISSFGLMRPKKGYEYLIEAMADVVKAHPNTKLLLIGRYHPQRNPEYYQGLKDRVKKLKLSDNVKFINKFVSYSDLLNYLMASNVFVAPFLVLDQVSSGTLTYAMACGRACVSTPFDYAKEVLADHRGLLVPPANSHAIAEEINFLIEHPKARHRMQNLSYKYVRQQIWSKTARNYLNLFLECYKEDQKKTKKESNKEK